MVSLTPPAIIGDYVWVDTNRDGQQGSAALEPPIAGVTVNLLDSTGTTIVGTTVTNASGLYSFTVAPGTYVVQVVAPAGAYSTFTTANLGADGTDSDVNPATGKTGPITVISGQTDNTNDAGLLPIDLELSKSVDNPTPLVGSNVTFTLTLVNNNAAPGVSTATGVTVSDPLPAGLTFVSSTPSQGSYNSGTGLWTVGTLAPGATATLSIVATVTSGGTKTNYTQVSAQGQLDTDSQPNNNPGPTPTQDDEAVVSLTPAAQNATLGNFFWHDLNGNGKQDGNEPGINGVTATLTGTDNLGNAVSLSQNTAGGGAYLFSNLAPGTYKVTFSNLPVGYMFTTQDVGANGFDTIDSDANPSTGATGNYTLVSAQNELTVDAGAYLAASKSGCIYVDSNGDGIHNNGVVDLGLARQFGVFGINGGNVILNSAHITGSVALGPGETATTLQKADVSGTLTVDPTATWDSSNLGKDFLVAGGVVTQNLAQAAADANAASVTAAALTADFSFGNVTANTTIAATTASRADGITVASFTSLNYNTDILTISGNFADVFVINVMGNWTYFDSQIVLTGGVTADHVLFNFPVSGASIEFSKATNVINGTFLAPYGSALYHNPAAFNGAIIAKNVTIHSDANLKSVPLSPGEGCLAGVPVTLTGISGSGQSVSLVTTTTTSGYNFPSLPPGTYTVTVTAPVGYAVGAINVGTINGAPDGIAVPPNQIAQIVVRSGDSAINDDFGLVRTYDFGDAPTSAQSGFANSYPTLISNGGASHMITSALKLGSQIDIEKDGQPSVTAAGDDTNNVDDEDGVALTSLVDAGTTATVSVTVSGSGGYLNAWIDFNRDGDWSDAGEQIFTDRAVVNGLNSLSFTVPANAIAGTSFARFRLSTQQNLAPTGQAPDGEVEDYKVVVGCVTGPIGGVNLGNLPNYLFVFADGSTDANWQGATKGFQGNVIVNGVRATERTSGTVPYAGTIYSNDSTLGAWQNIVNSNPGQAIASTGKTALVNESISQLNAAFLQINGLTATPGYTSVSATSLNGLNTQNNVAQTFVINVTSGFSVSTQINITGDASDVFILRWDTDANSSDGYEGQVKFQSGGAIIPKGGLTAGNFIHVAGDINASGGGSTPSAPYPQGPRYNDGTGALITGGSNYSGGGFFTGYWLTTGAPTNVADASHSMPYGNTAPLSNAIFVGGWYSITNKFSMTSGTSGVHVCPNSATQQLPQMLSPTATGMGTPTTSLTREQLTPLIQAATEQWSAMGVNKTHLNAVQFEVADLPGGTLGLYRNGVIQIDHDAAGTGWFIDQTPLSVDEFASRGNSGELLADKDSAAFGHVDLLTVITHELGHAVGVADVHGDISDIMDAEISTGVRRVEHVSTLYNSVIPTDVNGDGVTSPLDALLVINRLNGRRSEGWLYQDVNHDGVATPLDALLVINYLHSIRSKSDENSADKSITATEQVFAEMGEGESNAAMDALFADVEQTRRRGIRTK